MQAILTGDPFDTEEALEVGLIDAIIEGDLVIGAMAFAKARVAEGGPYPLARHKRDKIDADRKNPDVLKAGEAYLARRNARPVQRPDGVRMHKGRDRVRGLRRSHTPRAGELRTMRRAPAARGDDPRLLLRAPGGADSGRARRHADENNQQRRDHRRRVDGRRHRHELRRLRHSGEGAGSEPGGAGQGVGGHRAQLRPHGPQRPDKQVGARRAPRPHRGRAGLRCRRRRGHRYRSRL